VITKNYIFRYPLASVVNNSSNKLIYR